MNDLCAHGFVAFELQLAERFLAAQKNDATTGHDAFLNGGTRGVQRVLDAGLLLFHFGFGRSTHVDNGYAAGQLGQTFLQLLAVVVGGRFLDLTANLTNASLDVGVLASAFDDRRIVLIERNPLGLTQIVERHAL